MKTAKKQKAKSQKVRRGRLIVIDGTDGSGKATQTEALFKRLQKEGVKVKKIDFPRYQDNFWGKFLHEALKQNKHGDFIGLPPKIASTFFSMDRFETKPQLEKWLNAGFDVLADRYTSANQIHQGGKIADPAERKEFIEWLNHSEYTILGIPRPTVIVYLHVPLEVSLSLIKKRAAQKKEVLDQAESNAKHLLESQQSAMNLAREDKTWVTINCAQGESMRPIEEIHQELYKTLNKKMRWSKRK